MSQAKQIRCTCEHCVSRETQQTHVGVRVRVVHEQEDGCLKNQIGLFACRKVRCRVGVVVEGSKPAVKLTAKEKARKVFVHEEGKKRSKRKEKAMINAFLKSV